MDIALLGPVEVRVNGVALPVTAPKEQAVLALLALRAGTTVSLRALEEALWGESPPRSAAKALQTYVSHLRRVLPERSIITASGGYRLAVSPERVDATRFETLASSGRQRLADGNAAGAVAALQEGLDLWRGEPFVELTQHTLGAAWARRLEETRRTCEEDMVDGRLALGHHGALVAELEMAVAAQPLRERRWAQLMLALYREARQADALAAFQRLRTVLSEELGIDPSPELENLELAVLRQDPALNRDAGPGAVMSLDALERTGLGGALIAARTSATEETPPGTGIHGENHRGPETEGSGQGGPEEATHETQTVLFTDLVESTARSAVLSAEAADQFRRAHFALLRGAVRTHGGVLVKNLGDGVMATFASPSAAMSCAVAMQHTVEVQGRGAEVPVGLRIGISAGEVTCENGDYFGDPVVAASRLCDLAQSGEILLSEVVPLLAGRNGLQQLEAVGDLALKGLPDKVTTLRLSWVPLSAAEALIPLPHRLARDLPAGFIGRTTERNALVGEMGTSPGSQSRMVLVEGEAGIGKTTLMTVVARELLKAGTTVLYGRCDENLQVPYQPFIEALTHYVAHAPVELLAEHVAVYGGELLRLVPGLATRVPECTPPTSTEPDVERYLAFNAVAGLLAAATRTSAVLLVLDDLHWADELSLLLLRHVAALPDLTRLHVLSAYRGSEMSATDHLAAAVASLHREADLLVVELSGMTDEDVLRLTETVTGRRLDDAAVNLAREVRRETAGNPFFALELLRHLTETGVDLTSSDWTAGHENAIEGIGLPQSVRDVVVQRVHRIGEDAELVLSAAAVIGSRFDLRVLGAAVDMGENELLDQIERAQGAALITEISETGSCAFSHAIVRHALYERLSSARRCKLHRRIAEFLERGADAASGRDIRLLAHHWSRARNPDKSLQYAYLAGQAAVDALAPEEAMRWFQGALVVQAEQQPGDKGLRCDLLIGQGIALRIAGDPLYRQILLDAGALAAQLDDPVRMSRAALATYRGIWSSAGEVDRDKVAALEAALARMSGDDSPERARMLAILCNESTFDAPLRRRRELADEAKAMARRLGDPSTMIDVLTTVFAPLWVPDTLAERLSDTQLAQTLAIEIGDPVAVFLATGCRLRATTEAGLIDEADDNLRRLELLADEVRLPLFTWVTAFARGCRALLAGNLIDAERLMTEAFTAGTQSSQPDAQVFYLAGLTHVRLQQGRLGEFVAELESAAHGQPGIAGYWAATARAMCDGERFREAGAILERASAVGFSNLAEDSLRTPALAMYAEVAVMLNMAEPGRKIYQLLAPWHGRWSYMGVATDGPVDHFLGALAAVFGDFDAADEHLAVAHDMATAAGAAYFAARTELEWGRVLAARRHTGDLDRAGALLRKAWYTSVECGYAMLARRADAELARLNTPGPRSTA